MAQQRKRTAGDDLRDFKAGKISGNFYHNGIDRSDNYIQHTSAPRYITDENGKTQVASYNEWIQQEVFQHQHDLPNDTSSTSSNNKTATNDISVKSSNNTSSSAGSDIKSFFSGNLNNANSSAENFREAIKNPNKPLDDRVKGLTYMYNAAVATGDTKTAEKMQKEYDELADRVNKQAEINRHNAKEYARSQSLKGMTEERKALVDERNKYALDNGLVTSTGIDTRKKDRYKVYSEYNSKIDELDKQIAEKQRNGEYDLSDSQKAVLADIGNKANKLTESFENKYKNSTLEQRLNARLHATTSELNWLNKHMYDNATSEELEKYNRELSKEYENLYDRGTTGTDENKEARRRNIEDEQDKIDTYINRAKLSEQKKKEYDDIVDKNVILKTVMQKYYALQHYDDTKHMLASTGHDTDSIKNQVTLDDYNYINKLSDKERTQIEKNFKNLKKEGYDTESLYKWYERERDAEKAAETTRTSTEYANEHPVLGSIASVGARLGGAVPDAVKYISTDLDKKYNGGDGYINTEETGTAISDAMRAKVSENINNDFGSFLYNTGMSMADFASLLPLNAVPGGQALSLGIMGTSAGVGAANEVINNGGTIDNAVKTGIAAGIAETLFEKVSLEQLSAFKASGKSTFRAAVGNVLKGAFTEGSEEAFTDLANRLTDDAINKDLSSYNLSKKNYMEQGMSEAEAENAASWDFWKNVGLDFAGGAISGGVLNLATAGINLAGAKIDMAQNKESNAQIGKAVMADENFDLDLLIRQGLATDKNDKAYNYAKHMQKLVETDNEGKISAGDVGNLMYLINREVAKNPELVNKIAQVKKQNTQEQGNKTVNVQNEQNPTQQNTAQNGQQNAEQAQANTVINATKKADTEDIGKMYGVYAFGKKHPNGIIATDTSTGKVVKVALKSLESSAKINRSDEENTLVFNTNDGKQVNADSITFSDSQLDTIVHSANEFDTYGARNYISNFEEWRESPQAQKMTDDEMLYKYNRAYSAAYSFGREGVKLDSLRETSEYTILKNILGEQIVSQALSTGRRDVDINTQHHANRLTELINRNGRADTSGVSVYADSGTDVSHISQELINTLGNLATKTGRNIIISDRLADGVNGVARDGNIILSSEISSQKILATALHEAGHMIKKTNPTEWRTLSDFVSDYLVRKGVDLNKMIDRTIERYGNRLQADEHENTRDAALEEIVCDTLMSIASDEKALNIALSTKQNKSKIAAAIKSLIEKVKNWLIDKSTNYGAKAFAKDLEALENLAKRFSEAADTAKENITEQTEVQNGEKIDVEKFSYVGKTSNGIEVYETDESLKNITNKEKLDIFKNYLYSIIGQKIKFQHNKKFYYAEIDRFSIKENIKKLNPKHLNQWDKAKINIGANGDFLKLLENAKYDKTLKNNDKSKNDAHKTTISFAYYYKTVFVDGKAYDVIINIRNTKSGKYLYEVRFKSINKKESSQLEPQLEEFNNQRRSKVETTRLSELSPIQYQKSQEKSSDNEKFSLDEEDKDLVATHNISSQNLMNLINDFDGAGLPVPSIAIEKADSVHDNFGDVTLLFNKDTIDPQNNSKNNVYSRDAWTSTFPEVEVKIKDEELQKISERVHLNEAYLESNMFNTSDKERIKKNFFNDLNVRKAFLKEQNIEVTPVAYDKEPRFPMFTNIGVKKFLRKNNCSFDKLVNDIDFRNKLLNDYYDSCTIKSLANKNIQRVNKILDNCAKSKETYNSYKAEFEYAIEYAKGNVQKEINNFSYNDGVVNAIKEHKEEFKKYIEQILSEDVFREKYIVRDDVDPYDDEGNLKSFDETHYIYNIDNVVKAMKVGKSAVGNSLLGGMEYTKTISAQNLNSIDEIKSNEHKLQELSPEEIETQKENVSNLLAPIIREIADSDKYNNDFINASENIVDAFKAYNTIDGVYKYLKQYYSNLKKSSVNKLFKARDEIAKMPVRYFEAKPHRVVGFDEVMAAVIPAEADEKLKTALKKMNIPMYEYADESQRADAARKAINTEYEDKSGTIHDTLKFSIDDEYYDWLVNDDGKSVFDAVKDEKNPDRRISILYHYAGKTAEHGMRVGKDIRIGQSGMHRLVCNVLQEYGVNLNGKNKSRIEAFKSVVNDFENSVKNDTQSFNDAIESLAEECKEYLKKSSLIDKKHSEWAKDLSDSLKEVTLVIPKGDIDFIKSAYGSITNFRKALMGKINIRTAKGYALIESVNEGSIEDVGNSISEIIGDIAGIDETFNWRSEEGYKTLERFINYDLAEHFVSIDGKSVQSIDETAIEMAFDVATEYLKQQAKEVVLDNNANKELLHSITEIYNQANEEHELLLKEKNARYAEQISEQKKNAEKQIKSLVRKNNKKTEQYIKNDIKLRNKIKSDAKEYRITLRATKKTVAEEYRAERDKTKYRQKISTTLERLINRHLKPKPSNNVPISVVKPLYRLLSELTGNYSGFSKGVNDITEKTGYNKTVNQKDERVNKVTLSAETEKLISALNSEIANTDGKITLPPAMRNALLGYNVFDNKGNIKQHFTGLLEDVRNIFEKAEKNGKTSLKDFSLSELKRISTAFSEVKKLLDAANKIVINGKEYDAYLVSRKGAEELKKVTGTHKKGSNTQASTAKRTLLAYRKYMSDPIRFARMISGYHNDSVIVQLMDMLNQGQSDAEQLSIDWTNKYEEQMSRFSYKAKKDYVREQAMEFDGIDPNTKEELVDKKTGEQVKVGLTADMLVEMLLEYEDEYGRAHMMYSGYQVPNIKYIKRKNQQLMYSKDSGCYILPTESDISRIRDYVMNNEIAKTVYEICREMYNEDMQNAVNKVSNEKYGYEIAKVKNYCPITIDEDTVYGTFADVLINRSINSRAFLHERENFKYNRLKLKGATAKLTSQIKSVSSWCGLTMPIETFNRVFNMPRYDHKNDSLVKAVQEENLNSAENIRQKNNTHADEEEKSKLSIDEHFTDKYDEWDKKGGRFSFRVGTTSEVLQRLGVDDKNIWWDTSKILKIKNKHPEMTDDILKQVPNVLESPIIVMESYTVKGRLVLFGDVYDAKNNPVLVALELNPIGEGGKSLDIIKIASAYGKDSNLQHMIDKSNILYVEPNEKRTHTWLTGNGLQLPLPSSKYGFSDNIKSQNQGDVKYSVEKEAHSTLSIDEVLDFIEREEKQKKKKESTSTTEYFPSMKEIMKQQWGNESEEYISKLMGDLQGSTKQADPGRIDMLTGKYIRAVLTANISSAIKQLSSYPLAAARVGWKATLAGLKHIRPGKHTPFLNRALPDSYKQSIPYDEIAKYTPILEYRKQGNNSREMAEISRYKGLIDSSGWVGHTLDRLNWIEKNDVLMVEMNYWIAYEHVKGNMGISPDSKEFMPNVAKTLEDIINNMMPNSSVMQQGQILRSKNPVNRIFTICKSQVFCMVNAAMDASGEYNARLKDYKQAVSESEKKQARTEVKIAKKQLARTYSAIIVSTAMTCGILMPLIAALFGKWDRYRDEDGNITPWSVGSRLLKDFGSELTGMFLFGDTVYNTVLALIDKNEEFYGLSLPGVDTINDFITGIINIARSDTPEKLRKNISSLVGTLGMLTGLPTKNLMNLFQGACNHIENFTKYGGTPTVNDYGEVSMQMYANYCYEALIDGDKKKFAKLYSEWLKGKTSTGKQVDKSYINSKLKTELEDDTEIIAAGNAFFNGDLTAYENTVEKYSDLGFDKTTVVKAINSIVSDLEDEQKNAEGLDKYDNEEESDSKPELYKYSDAFDFLKNGDTANYEKVEKYLMEHKGKTKNQMKKLMQSASRTDPMFEQYISASKSNDADTTHTLYRQLLNVYGSESRFKSALRKYQDKIKKRQGK